MPDGGEKGFWAKALGAKAQFDHDFDTDVYGMRFGSNNNIFVPAVGYLDFWDFGGISPAAPAFSPDFRQQSFCKLNYVAIIAKKPTLTRARS